MKNTCACKDTLIIFKAAAKTVSYIQFCCLLP